MHFKQKPELLAQCRPVTCVEVVNKYIFICEGPGISVCSKDGSKICQQIVFPAHKTVLGLSVKDIGGLIKIFVYGQNYANIVYFENSRFSTTALHCEFFLAESPTFVAARWLDNGDLTTLTDENILLIYRWKLTEALVQDVFCKRIQGVQTTLFSATISGGSLDCLQVFSGTNLGQIYVWCPQETQKTFHLLLEGVKGSVLSLKYCDKNQILVASTDQRSVFAWKFHCPISRLGKDESCPVSLVSEMIGHTGRVWDVDICAEYIISAGQDSNVILWSTTGELLKYFSGPSIVDIRCCRVDYEDNSIISGSDDGSVCKWTISNEVTNTALEIESDPADSSGSSNDYPRHVTCLRTSEILVSMNSGRFILIKPNGKQVCLFRDSEFMSYNTLTVAPHERNFAVGSKNGWIYFVSFNRQQNARDYSENFGCCLFKFKLDSKIVSLHWIDTGVIVAATCVHMYLVKWNNSLQLESEDDFVCNQQHKMKLNWKDKPGVSAAVLLTSYEKVFFILSDELGNVHLFDSGKPSETPLFTIPKLHGSYGVCDFKVGPDWNTLWSVGRNRSIINLKLEMNPQPELVIIQKVESCLTWNAKLINSPNGTFACGFAENDFVVLDIVNDHIVKKFFCGGAHRSWDIAFNGVTTFAFIRRKQLYCCKFSLNTSIIQGGIFGGKTINSITTFKSIQNPTSNSNFGIVTAGEDGILRYSEASVHGTTVTTKRIAKLKSHASSVRVVKVSPEEEELALHVFSGGGRSQLVVSKLHCRNQNITWTQLTSAMVMILHSDGKSSFSNTDMRIMDINFKQEGRSHFTLVCACSDGLLRVLTFKDKKIELTSTFHGFNENIPHALTCVQRLGTNVYSANSVGQVGWFPSSIFDIHNPTPPPNRSGSNVHSIYAAEATITSMQIAHLTNSTYLVTGSDNGVLKIFQVHMSVLRKDEGIRFQLVDEDRLCHSAAINAASVVNDYVVAASADQAVSVRKFNDRSFLKSFRCGVCDVQDICLTQLYDDHLLILLVGQGFEIRRMYLYL